MKSANWVFFGICALSLAAVFVLAWHGPKKPDLIGATPAQIRAALPADLVEETPLDPAAVDRFNELARLLKTIDYKKFAIAADPKTPAQEVAKLANEFRVKFGSTLSAIDHLLVAGPLQIPKRTDEMSAFVGLMEVKTDAKCLSAFGKSMADGGDVKTGVDMLITAVKISDAFLHSKGALIMYFSAIACEAISFKGIQDTIANPRFPASECERLLSALPASPAKDQDLRIALRTEFQGEMMGKLSDAKYMALIARAIGDPSFSGENSEGPSIGSYDALATAKGFGALYEEAMANTGKRYAEIDQAALRAAQAAASDLPKQVDDLAKRADDGGKYQTAMSSGKNTVGRLVLAATAKDSNMNAASCTLYARRDCTRVDLAATIYRSSHGGSQPASKEELTSILGQWPTDPFNGKPMIYDPKKEVVYSVGRNLKDDRGDFTMTPEGSVDVGVSLKRPLPTSRGGSPPKTKSAS